MKDIFFKVCLCFLGDVFQTVSGKCQPVAGLTGAWEFVMPVLEIIITQKTPLI